MTPPAKSKFLSGFWKNILALRNLYLWVIGLLFLTGFAFWRSYFSRLGETSWPYHVHGIVSTLWVLLFIFQNVSINQSRLRLHRQLGLSIMVIVPIFTAAGLMMINTMTASTSRFFVIFGDRLAFVDIIGSFAFAWLCYGALANRRIRTLHAGYFFMTILLLIMPVISRIQPLSFLLPNGSMQERFELGFDVASGIQLVLAGALYFNNRKHAAPFIEFGGIVIFQWIGFYWINHVPGWHRIADGVASSPTVLVGLMGLIPGILAVIFGWRSSPKINQPLAPAD